MAQPYVGEIIMFAGNFPPSGWMTCDGQLLQISDYEVLFELIGTTYGGDGESTYALPNLNGRVPNHMGSNGTTNYVVGQTAGVATVQLTQNQIPLHTHSVIADGNPGSLGGPTNAYYASAAPAKLYGGNASPLVRTMNPVMLPNAGGSQPHDNMQPFVALNFCISLFGVFPTPT